MAQKNDTESPQTNQGGTATKSSPKADPKQQPPKPLPPWKVLLHNDDQNDIEYVVLTIMSLTALNQESAVQRTLEAHKSGVALLLTTHKERAELYRDQFGSKGLTVTIESAE
jgi:ATP-dependent Clp protease adaptor protein ClpS